MKRPRTRGECPRGTYCPWFDCRYHLPPGSAESCALDVAEKREHDAYEIAELLQCSVGHVYEIISAAIAKVRAAAVEEGDMKISAKDAKEYRSKYKVKALKLEPEGGQEGDTIEIAGVDVPWGGYLVFQPDGTKAGMEAELFEQMYETAEGSKLSAELEE